MISQEFWNIYNTQKSYKNERVAISKILKCEIKNFLLKVNA